MLCRPRLDVATLDAATRARLEGAAGGSAGVQKKHDSGGMLEPHSGDSAFQVLEVQVWSFK